MVIKALLPYILGIALFEKLGGNKPFLLILLTIFFCLTLGFQYVIKHFRKQNLKFLFAFSAFFMFLFFGMLNSAFHKHEKPDIEQFNNKIVVAQVNSPLEEKQKSWKTSLKIFDTVYNQNFEVFAYFAKDSAVVLPSFGDLIAFKSDFQPITSSKNPMEFNYAGYMEMQNIFYTAYIKSNCFTILKPNFSRGIKHYATFARERMLNYYRSKNIDGQEFAVLAALTLGYKNDLDDQTRNAFQASGAMHVLAVSGLHVGIILMITNFILGFLGNSFIGRLTKFLLVETIIWTFAAVTGFSPSVNRAALMFSFVAFGQLLNRNSDIYSTLASSAFILLIINPFTLFNVGFGLSYIAVLGIVAIMPIFERLYNPENKIVNYFYMLLAVSIAAQIATAVLSIYCFNRFPNYFLLSAPIVVPLAYVIMLLAVAMFLFGFWSDFSDILAIVVKYCVKFLNNSVSYIEKLPGSVTENIFIDVKTAILLYGIIFSLVILYHYREIFWLKFGLFLLILVCIFRLIEIPERNSNGLAVVYNCRGNSVLQFSNVDTSIVLTDVAIDNRDKYFYELFSRPCALTGGGESVVDELSGLKSDFSNNIFNIDGKTFVVISDSISVKNIEPYHFDYVVVAKKYGFNVEEMNEKFSPEKLIFSSVISKKYSKKLKNLCDSLSIPSHFVGFDGAFVYGRGSNLVWNY